MTKNINLDDNSLIEKLDTEDMYHKIIHLPEQIMKAYNEPEIHQPENFNCLLEAGRKKPISRIIVAGMGGSAISGDILQALFSHIVPIQVFKDYQIPVINKNDLFIACSYSGNTEETVSCLEQALKQTDYLAAVTSGGIVGSLIGEQYLKLGLPQGYPPRSAIGYLFFSLVIILEKFAIIDSQKEQVEQTVASLMLKAGAVSKGVATDKNIAKQAAQAIDGKIPLIYSANPTLYPVSYRWKCQINENSKYPAFTHTFPEMNHNEIEAWENSPLNNNFIPLFIGNLQEDRNYQKRIDFFKSLMDKENINYLDFYGEGHSQLEKVFSLIYLGDMISFYLAIMQQMNPTTINFIIELKKEIG